MNHSFQRIMCLTLCTKMQQCDVVDGIAGISKSNAQYCAHRIGPFDNLNLFHLSASCSDLTTDLRMITFFCQLGLQ